MKALRILMLSTRLVMASSALAHDHNRPELNDWFQGLHAKGGAWCCTGDDAEVADEWTTDHGHYRVKVGEQWFDVPDDALIEGPNRAEHALVWPWHGYMGTSIRCFMPGTMS